MKKQDEQENNTQLIVKNEDIAVTLPDAAARVDVRSLFGQPGPVEIEVGSGKGTFLLHQARKHSDINYLGIEYANKYYLYCVDRMARWGMRNVRVLRTDAKDFVKICLPDSCVQAFHVYFPDPWPKTRQQKRRFFHVETVLHVARSLLCGGQLRIATDHAEYFEWISTPMLGHELVTPLFEKTDFFPTDAADQGEWVGSNFERKYAIEGRKTHVLALKRTENPVIFR